MKFTCTSAREAIIEGGKHVYEYEFSGENGPMKLGCFHGLFEIGKTYTFGIEFLPDIS